MSALLVLFGGRCGGDGMVVLGGAGAGKKNERKGRKFSPVGGEGDFRWIWRRRRRCGVEAGLVVASFTGGLPVAFPFEGGGVRRFDSERERRRRWLHVTCLHVDKGASLNIFRPMMADNGEGSVGERKLGRGRRWLHV
ncbi:hypothetical protein HAX54_011206, partial [Datura stramonium]|nr:hypothetical protein [Datura stramonium]